ARRWSWGRSAEASPFSGSSSRRSGTCAKCRNPHPTPSRSRSSSGSPSPSRVCPRPGGYCPTVRLWPTTGLWRHGDFLRLWSGQTISQFGSQISQLAIPLAAIIVLDASAFEVAMLSAIEFLPFLLLTLPAGVWVDRLRRRPILIWSDVGRALALVSVPIAY